MGKKRKATNQALGPLNVPNGDKNNSKLKVNTFKDVPDSEDDFHLNRDKVLLEDGPGKERRKRWQAKYELLEPSDEEVLAYSPSALDPEDDEEIDDHVENDDMISNPVPNSKRSRRCSGSEASADPEEDEDAGGWGSSKRDYYNADTIETEADALEEEAEARRLQLKHLQSLAEADYGYNEDDWLESGKSRGVEGDEDSNGGVITEVLPQLEITESMSEEERLKILKTRWPEFEPLAEEFLALQPLHQELGLAAGAAETIALRESSPKRSQKEAAHGSVSVALIKHRALAAYLGALSMYFALLTSTSKDSAGTAIAMPATQLRDHAIMESLVKSRQLWEQVKDVQVQYSSKDLISKNAVAVIDEEKSITPLTDEIPEGRTEAKPAMKPKKSRAERAADLAEAEATARRAERLRKIEEELASLSNLTSTNKLRRTTIKNSPSGGPVSQLNGGDNSNFGEETHLTPHEAAEKARKKKSLRFYTSQIAQKSNKRDAAGRDAGGDADLPYRERLRDRQARLNADAERRGKNRRDAGGTGHDLGGESDEEDRRQARELREDAGSEEDYYDLVTARSKKRNTEKAGLAEAYAQAANEGGMVQILEGVVGPDGKRAISYAIEKNKGLAPKRKKDVRNPRVKKRKKYEDRKKKLGSVRQVYKGGEGKGGYGGELTGIKKGLVKSVRL
ncbi:MAG: hypothetical protein M1827_006537 [Pycnora praestabilis]|nr:MAG: hypothetical protein M1827_006537 [Pycnora praestabilis]